jgi:hypothetical protein
LVSIQRVNWCHWQSVFANGFPKGGSILWRCLFGVTTR